MVDSVSESRLVFRGTNAERLALQTINLEPLTLFITSEGNKYEWDGNSWVQISTSGSAHFTFGQSTYDIQTNDNVDQALIEIATFDVTSNNIILIETIVTLQALDKYAVLGQISGGTVHTLFDEAGDFTSPDAKGLILMAFKFITATGAAAANNDLTTTAALSSALLKLDVRNYDTISIEVACASDNGNTVTHGSAQ